MFSSFDNINPTSCTYVHVSDVVLHVVFTCLPVHERVFLEGIPPFLTDSMCGLVFDIVIYEHVPRALR